MSDVADGDPMAAPHLCAALAAEPGLRLSLGYDYAALNLAIDHRPAPVPNASGVDLGAQYGLALARDAALGFTIVGHVPDRSIARVAFRPATEPQFVRYEAGLGRTTLDLVTAVRWRFLSLGGGVAGALDVGGGGTRFVLGQDASGTYADASTDVELPYRLAPIAGARVDLGPVAVAASFRGALAVDLDLVSDDRIALTDNPLNGTTRVVVRGSSGYDPATVTLGTRVTLGAGVSAHLAFEYAAWSAAPPPVADVDVAVNLKTSPPTRDVTFVEPRFRDTISPHLGIELLRSDDDSHARPVQGLFGDAPRGVDDWRFALRAGWTVSPSPVPRQTGLTSYADATRHALAFGSALRLGRAAGVDVAVAMAGQLHVLVAREEAKPNLALPYARYTVSGNALFGSFALEGTWR